MSKDFNLRMVIRVAGGLLLIESLFILTSCIVSFVYNESDWVYFAATGVGCILLGALFFFWGRGARKTLGKREGSVVVTSVWVVFSLAGMMPFWLSGSIPSFVDAFFETMSGFTTTSATIVREVEALSYGMLYWRSLTNWIGGLGIVVISLALLPMFGFSGMQLFGAENTSVTKEKLHPKITETTKWLCYIYVLLTLLTFLLLMAGGMNAFDALCHAYSTISAGGFSTRQAGIAYWTSPFIQYVAIFSMILSGINFNLYYFMYQKKWKKIGQNEEFRTYWALMAVFTCVLLYSLIDFNRIASFTDFEMLFRRAFFQVASTLSSTCSVSVDYAEGKSYTWLIIIVCMIIGASAGSTSGGIKVMRIVIAVKFCYYEFKRMVHPNAVIPISYSGEVIKPDVVMRILSFILLYIGIIVLGTFVLLLAGLTLEEAFGSMISCLSCMGAGFGQMAVVGHFAVLSVFVKYFLSFVMLLGRLELFTVLLLFTPVFWKK